VNKGQLVADKDTEGGEKQTRLILEVGRAFGKFFI
jgi:hypothetical protein